MTLRGLFTSILWGCSAVLICTAAHGAQYQTAPTVIPHTTRDMKTAGYWISRHPSPDKVILTPEEISQFNRNIIEKLNLSKDITRIPDTVSGDDLKAELAKTVDDIQKKNLYNSDGFVAPAGFYASIKEDMDLEGIPQEVNVQYGFTVHFSDQRFFPMAEGLYAQKSDIDFDELQNSDLDVATPVAVLHKSKGGQWLYVRTDISDGWVEAKNIAICSREDIRSYAAQKSWVIVTRAKADIYMNLEETQYYDYIRMGTRLAIEQVFDTGAVEVRLPSRQTDGTLAWVTGYVSEMDVHKGFLAYTPRHVLEQAFVLLNEPYGWGGMNGEQDCSRFLHEIFSTFGINLPRNSKEQAQSAKVLAAFSESSTDDERMKALKEQAVGGSTLLGMKGHIMLFLGMDQGRPYAIHATWGYRQPDANGEDSVRVVNRVIVSDLSLGEGSKKGSLLHRLSSIVMIGP